ncbi:hypothetical protein SDJN02_09318, partial [Cucurbita argyrosperma subsp. argyrosperma]
MDDISAQKPYPPPPNLRRRNSIAVPVVLSARLNPPPHSLTYTSLRDILPSPTSMSSPTAASAANSGFEISIRNRLVKQAAWAYLQPMSSSPGSSGPHLLRRIWLRFSACLGFLNLHIISSVTKALDRIFRVVGFREIAHQSPPMWLWNADYWSRAEEGHLETTSWHCSCSSPWSSLEAYGRTRADHLDAAEVVVALAAHLDVGDVRSSAKCQFSSLIKWISMLRLGSIPNKVFVNVLKAQENKFFLALINC